MDTFSAWMRGEAALRSGARVKVFDWNKAARLIRERKPSEAGAGLHSDWEYTGGAIYRDGKPVPKKDTYVYLASNWATPELDLDGEIVDCFFLKGDEGHDESWDAGTYWPPSALEILNGTDP